MRALGMLELQRRRFVRDRTKAIQRLRSDWTQIDPGGGGRTVRCDRERELSKLKRIQLRREPCRAHRSRCIRELAKQSTTSTTASAQLDREIAELLAEHNNPLD